jgi:short-subunit dehydrogenase
MTSNFTPQTSNFQKTALVTGASSGIGEVFARELAKSGYLVTCVARSKEKLEHLTEELGPGHRVLVADLGDPSQLQRVVEDIEKTGYSLLVNNAGYGIYRRFEKIPMDKLEQLMAVNMSAVVRLSHAFLKKAVSGDALINISSALSLLTYPGGAVYAATKSFVTNFTESLWFENKDRGVYVLAVLPGLTDTNFHCVATGGRQKTSPGGKSYPPETIVKDALAALAARKKPSIVTGPLYRFLTFLSSRLMSRKSMVTVMGQNSPALKKWTSYDA